ncbi:hypothetical protein [Leifsonia sp. Leaf264]|uniref:hypothetical protein n=1 Tax=Leifsonia sp. Leaf264 TaxID=1736314 RepID=UPI0006F3C031|nr:hypothetical protein [Leifsonia sp. Leaf264]KQO98451.1 hypothetical protein ASF30_10340 [Leifsonia sp. Leaf264]
MDIRTAVMPKLRSIRRASIITLTVGLTLTAIVGIAMILTGDFDETRTRILGTTALVGSFGVAALAHLAPARRVRWSPSVGLYEAGLALILGLICIWNADVWQWEFVWKTFLIAAILSAALVNINLLALLGGRTRPFVKYGLRTTYATIGLLYGMGALIVITPDVWSEGYARAMAVLWILAALGTIVVPVTALFLRDPVADGLPVMPTLDEEILQTAAALGISRDELMQRLLASDPDRPAPVPTTEQLPGT